ncbi:MAG: hypothetical protein C7B45_10495 [Sulfobacillus acidophilus]|uniref:PH domain-containing protein n=1 Tax=Sulfobacillus acidophilus TaxID=53633 RepID=A0A2T2WH29_9FIRM|nr:MAG: hypothetical protein C7B45_10495 [Sulfobacillus acidophilus]
MITLTAQAADQEVLEWIHSLKGSTSLLVRGRYTHALYLQGGSKPLVLLSCDQPVGPFSVVVSSPSFGREWGDVGVVEQGRIVVGSRTVRLDQTQPYRTMLVSREPWHPLATNEVMRTIWPGQDVLSHVPNQDIRQRLHRHVEQLLNGLKADDTGLIRRGLAALIGLGPGATPAGDDILVGLLVSFSVHRPEWAQQIRANAPDLAELGTLTTLASVVELVAAMNGRVFSVMNDVVRWLVSPQFDDWSCVTRLTQSGHTSGRDMLAGMMFGASAASKHGGRGA